MKFLHDETIINGKAVVHGEVTAKSVFVCIRKGCHPAAAIAKIGDLEVCGILGKGVCPSLSCTSYKSPEVWLWGSHIPSFTDDIYAIGVLMIHTMLQECPRYESLDDPVVNGSQHIFDAYITRGVFFAHTLKHVLTKILSIVHQFLLFVMHWMLFVTVEHQLKTCQPP